MMKTFISPVIAIDGPSGSGKGAVAQRAAKELSFHYLDSGAIYRVGALAALRANVSLTDEARLARPRRATRLRFLRRGRLSGGQDVSLEVRSEATGNAASTIAALPGLRVACSIGSAFRQPPGLVAMAGHGFVVSPTPCSDYPHGERRNTLPNGVINS
jgi:cytidylate kinase